MEKPLSSSAPNAPPRGNPKDSMKSTWRTDKSQWSPAHWTIDLLNMYWRDLDKPVPTFAKTEKVPYLTEWSCHRFIIIHAIIPMVIHKLYTWIYRTDLHPMTAFALYSVAMQANSIHQIHCVRRLGHQIGFFDGDKHERDEVPDVGVEKTLHALTLTTVVRPAMAVLVAYHRGSGPSLSWWLPVELSIYSLVLDGYFYLYHRACHEVDFLWRIHRTHHLTKHPNPLLSSYADHEQEFLEIALIPLITWLTLKAMGFPMGFYDWWICYEYVIFAEALGHSGLRMHTWGIGPLSWFFILTNTELGIEDHDLHHRHGWRTSFNYGKQTRIWDTLFGTRQPRLETSADNIDWTSPVNIPLV